MSNLTAIIDADVIKPVYSDFYNSRGEHKTRINNKKTKECQLWENMRMRATNRLRPEQKTYGDIYVCKSWLDFQNFASWVVSQNNWDTLGWELDKDILSSGVKIYSPSTCAFIPKALNNFFNDYSTKGGTSKHKGISKAGEGFDMGVRYDGIRIRAYSKNEEDLAHLYSQHKKEAAKYFIKKYSGLLDQRVVKLLEDFSNE